YLGSLSFSSVSSSSRLGGGVARPGFGTGRGAMLADPPNGFGRLPGVAANLGVAGRMSGASALSSSSVLLAGLAKGLLAGLSAPGFGPKGLGRLPKGVAGLGASAFTTGASPSSSSVSLSSDLSASLSAPGFGPKGLGRLPKGVAGLGASAFTAGSSPSSSSVSLSSDLSASLSVPGFGPKGLGRLPKGVAGLGASAFTAGSSVPFSSASPSSSVLLAGLAKGLLAGLSVPGFGPNGLRMPIGVAGLTASGLSSSSLSTATLPPVGFKADVVCADVAAVSASPALTFWAEGWSSLLVGFGPKGPLGLPPGLPRAGRADASGLGLTMG